MPATRIMYVELKSGRSGDGPAWISRVRLSKTKRSVLFRGKELQRTGCGSYLDVATREEDWVSGPKKSGGDRHWAGADPCR